MSENKEIRWKQRFSNFSKALSTLAAAVALFNERGLSDLEKQGLIQGFEFTHELCWKTFKDFFAEKGNANIYGSKDATREAFNNGLINNGDEWMNMITSRNLSSHTYDNEISDEIVNKITRVYFDLFNHAHNNLKKLL